MTVHVVAPARYAAQARLVKRTAVALLDVAFAPGVDVAFSLMERREMARLNQQFRGHAGPTDVLSFPGEPLVSLGDVALCVPVAARQARALGHALAVELRVLTVHALVHLAGMDHERSAQEALMQCEMEMGLLCVLGVDPAAALTRRGL